ASGLPSAPVPLIHSPIRLPRRPLALRPLSRSTSRNGSASSVAASVGSMPRITSRTSAASTTCLPMGPAVSCSAEIGTTPDRLTRPSVGLIPTTPFWPDGQTIEPSVSVPMATVARSDETEAAEPEDEPHGLRSSTYGLLVWPPTALHPLDDAVERKFAHSDRFAFPSTTAPAARSRFTRNAS